MENLKLTPTIGQKGSMDFLTFKFNTNSEVENTLSNEIIAVHTDTHLIAEYPIPINDISMYQDFFESLEEIGGVVYGINSFLITHSTPISYVRITTLPIKQFSEDAVRVQVAIGLNSLFSKTSFDNLITRLLPKPSNEETSLEFGWDIRYVDSFQPFIEVCEDSDVEERTTSLTNRFPWLVNNFTASSKNFKVPLSTFKFVKYEDDIEELLELIVQNGYKRYALQGRRKESSY